MHKHSDGTNKPLFLYSLAVLIFASAGIALRAAEIGAALDPKTGLAVFTPLTVAMIAFSCLAAAFLSHSRALRTCRSLRASKKTPSVRLPLCRWPFP